MSKIPFSNYRVSIFSAWIKLKQKHPGKATKVYRRFHKLIDQIDEWFASLPELQPRWHKL